MYGNRFYAAHPNSFNQLMEDYLWQNGAGGDLLDDQVIDFVEPSTDRDLVLGPRAWVRPRPRWCSATGKGSCPRRQPTRRNVVLLPVVANSGAATPRSGRQYGRGAFVDAHRANGNASATDMNSLPRRKQTGCLCSNRTLSDTGNAPGVTPWQFTADMTGCPKVEVVVEGDTLIVVGQGLSDSTHKMMQYTTPLPRQVRQGSILASLNNGVVTVTHKSEAEYLEDQANTLETKMQQQPQGEKPLTAMNNQDLQNTPDCMLEKQQKSLKLREQQQQKKASNENKQ